MTKLWMVRHGPTHAKTMVGWSDLPADLSDKNKIAKLFDYLPNDAVVVSSDLIRASKTADAIQGDRQRLPDDKNLREIHFGAWEMRGYKEIEADSPDHIRAYWDQPGDVRPPGGESWHDVSFRVSKVIDDLTQASFGNIIVVAHMGAILTQVQRALNITAYEAFGHRIDNLSVTELHSVDGKLELHIINHIP